MRGSQSQMHPAYVPEMVIRERTEAIQKIQSQEPIFHPQAGPLRARKKMEVSSSSKAVSEKDFVLFSKLAIPLLVTPKTEINSPVASYMQGKIQHSGETPDSWKKDLEQMKQILVGKNSNDNPKESLSRSNSMNARPPLPRKNSKTSYHIVIIYNILIIND